MEKKNLMIVIGITIIILLIVNGVFLFRLTGSVVKEDTQNYVESEKEEDEREETIDSRIIVNYVKDGDSITLNNSEEVRLIGINAPEFGKECYEEAKEELEKLVLGKEITLENDIDNKDQYERLLRYVYVDNIFVNLEMVRLGFAHKYEYGSNTKYSSQFKDVEDEAKETCRCIWQPCKLEKDKEPPKVPKEPEETISDYIEDECFTITNFHFNAAGNDNYNLNDEYITLKNKCDYQIDMTRWSIKDETASHLYYFPQFIIGGGKSFTLFTGTGTDTNSKLYWGREEGNYAAVWNNNGDTLFLRDAQGNLVLSKSYEGF